MALKQVEECDAFRTVAGKARCWSEFNQSGIMPTEYKVVIKPIEVEEKTKGGIILPSELKDKEQHAQQEGTLIAVSPVAFNYEQFPDGAAPKPGDRVLFAKYAGFTHKGIDGEDYRIVNDRDICAVLA